jgi:hypothetical protein
MREKIMEYLREMSSFGFKVVDPPLRLPSNVYIDGLRAGSSLNIPLTIPDMV